MNQVVVMIFLRCVVRVAGRGDADADRGHQCDGLGLGWDESAELLALPWGNSAGILSRCRRQRVPASARA
ncbi:hypothetical protein BU52_22685 [Streptomyces toyocaensis]|uniref:Uncharacterized protein n=1 Tax=Streptomyces toyocaensis TaxID=55952 RepID=A0A081XMT3_STRTO|nr:hypothetical protein BU52_22685 [Streptomyces toyocaensis]